MNNTTGFKSIDYTAHVDKFVCDNIAPKNQWPEFLIDHSLRKYSKRLNCVYELLDRHVEEGRGRRAALQHSSGVVTYSQLLDRSNRVAEVLVSEFGLIPGNRVLLHGFNNPLTVAAWLGILKAGGVVVATMPMLRSQELLKVMDRAKVNIVLSDDCLLNEVEKAVADNVSCEHLCSFNTTGVEGKQSSLEVLMASRTGKFDNIEASWDDAAIIAFTSGTTGQPKGCIHSHKNILAISDSYARTILNPTVNDVFLGSAPLAFTFGLGASLIFPLRAGASSVLVEKSSPETFLEAISQYKVTVTFTAPTAYQRMLERTPKPNLPSLRLCVSAGEPLPTSTWHAWHKVTGIRICDGIGSTEMLHIFISSLGLDIRPGFLGKAIAPYQAKIVDSNMENVGYGEIGHLAVRGPTGCRYLADKRQQEYVKEGWNLTGDLCQMDRDGYISYQSRADDLIVSSGYKISGIEVESVLLEEPIVEECAVIGVPSRKRGHDIKAFIVIREIGSNSTQLIENLKAFVRRRLATYKCPHSIEFVSSLPKTQTGKLKRYVLRKQQPSTAVGNLYEQTIKSRHEPNLNKI
jgi:2-aminobenzoate-CoA ligase